MADHRIDHAIRHQSRADDDREVERTDLRKRFGRGRVDPHHSVSPEGVRGGHGHLRDLRFARDDADAGVRTNHDDGVRRAALRAGHIERDRVDTGLGQIGFEADLGQAAGLDDRAGLRFTHDLSAPKDRPSDGAGGRGPTRVAQGPGESHAIPGVEALAVGRHRDGMDPDRKPVARDHHQLQRVPAIEAGRHAAPGRGLAVGDDTDIDRPKPRAGGEALDGGERGVKVGVLARGLEFAQGGAELVVPIARPRTERPRGVPGDDDRDGLALRLGLLDQGPRRVDGALEAGATVLERPHGIRNVEHDHERAGCRTGSVLAGLGQGWREPLGQRVARQAGPIEDHGQQVNAGAARQQQQQFTQTPGPLPLAGRGHKEPRSRKPDRPTGDAGVQMGDDDRADAENAERDPASGNPRDGDQGLHGDVVHRERSDVAAGARHNRCAVSPAGDLPEPCTTSSAWLRVRPSSGPCRRSPAHSRRTRPLPHACRADPAGPAMSRASRR